MIKSKKKRKKKRRKEKEKKRKKCTGMKVRDEKLFANRKMHTYTLGVVRISRKTFE